MKIEKNVPIPPKGTYRHQPTLGGTVRRMQPGDSILVRERAEMQRAYQAGRAKFGTGSIVTRAVPKGYRIWRVK